MSIPSLPDRVSAEELDRLRELGHRVRKALASTGIPVAFQPDPFSPPAEVAGAHIYLDVTVAGVVHVRWQCEEELVERSLAASRAGNYDSRDLRVKVEAAYAMGEAVSRILSVAGYETGLGVDMAAADVWVKPRA